MTGVKPTLGRASLTALVIGNTLGAGVFTTSGFVLAELGSPAYVLLAWLVGGLLALCGAVSYGALSRLMPQSGGEYLFLSRTVHPLAGFVAGWVSLWAGFTAAIAFAAITFEVYLLPVSLREQLPENVLASAVIGVAALAHGLNVGRGALFQTVVVAVKIALLCAFLAFVFLTTDPGSWPGVKAWREAPETAFSIAPFALALMWISFSYSGFNASIYVAGEAKAATRLVPDAMLRGTLLITVLYLLLNGVFLFAPEPSAIAGQKDIAAVAAVSIAGEGLAGALRVLIALAMFTSVSAMVMAGPRVYAQMAADGLMPAFLRFESGVPAAAIAMQALLSIALVWLSGLRDLLSYLGFTLSLSAAATVSTLFLLVRRGEIEAASVRGYPWAPSIFVAGTVLLACLAASQNPMEMAAAVLTVLSALAVYRLVR